MSIMGSINDEVDMSVSVDAEYAIKYDPHRKRVAMNLELDIADGVNTDGFDYTLAEFLPKLGVTRADLTDVFPSLQEGSGRR